MISKTFYFNWEISLIKWLQTNLATIAVPFCNFFAVFGSEIVCVVAIMLVYLAYDKKIGRIVMLNTIIGMGFACAIKNIALRRRPYFDNNDVKCLVPVEKDADIYDIAAQGYSFPSLHSFNIVCISGSIYKYIRKNIILIISIIMSLCVGISRIISANHFPTDVLAGWAIGLISIYVISYLQAKCQKKKFYLVITILSLLCFFFCKSNDFYSTFGIMEGFFLADLYEEKYVKFENTKNIYRALLRVVGALITFASITEGIKLLVPKEFSLVIIDYIIRSLRYGLGTFITLGMYPKLFAKNIFKLK